MHQVGKGVLLMCASLLSSLGLLYFGALSRGRLPTLAPYLAGRSQYGDRHVDLFARIFLPEVIAQEHLVRGRAEPGQVHRFPVNLDRFSGAGNKCADEFSIDSC